MLKYPVKEAVCWLRTKHTSPFLVDMTEYSLLAQNSKSMMESCQLKKYKLLLTTHYALDWNNILEDRIPIMYLDAHQQYMSEQGTFYSVSCTPQGI